MSTVSRFPNGARVCFLGDSITAANLHVSRIAAHYRKYFKNDDVRFYNCGVSGGTLQALLQYFDDDTALRRPTHAVIMLAVNDCSPWLLEDVRGEARFAALNDRYTAYQRNLREMVDKLQAMGVAVTLCTPVPYAEYEPVESKVSRGCYAMVAAYAEFVRGFARDNNLPLCDVHSYISEQMQYQTFFGADRTHPNDLGQYHMAKCFLAFQGLTIDEYAPIPEDLTAWRKDIAALRQVFGAEWNVIQNYSLSDEEKTHFVKTYLAEKKYENSIFADALKSWAEDWLKYQPNVKQLIKNTESID